MSELVLGRWESGAAVRNVTGRYLCFVKAHSLSLPIPVSIGTLLFTFQY